MAVGWAHDGAVHDQIASSLEDEVARVRSLLPQGESLRLCLECGDKIPEARRLALPGVRLCVVCQEEAEALGGPAAGSTGRSDRNGRLR